MQYGMLFSGPVFIRTVGHFFDQFSIDVDPAFFSRGLNCHCCPVVGGSFSLWSTGALDVFLMAVLVRVERVSGPSRP